MNSQQGTDWTVGFFVFTSVQEHHVRDKGKGLVGEDGRAGLQNGGRTGVERIVVVALVLGQTITLNTTEPIFFGRAMDLSYQCGNECNTTHPCIVLNNPVVVPGEKGHA